MAYKAPYYINQTINLAVMKNFNQLSIGDIIFKLCDKHDLGKAEKTQVHSILIENLSIDKTNGNLLINKSEGSYHSPSCWTLIIQADKITKSHFTFSPKENVWRGGFYFTDKNKANYVVRRAVISKINNIQKSIPETIKAKQQEILILRNMFHEILNPSFYPDYKVI